MFYSFHWLLADPHRLPTVTNNQEPLYTKMNPPATAGAIAHPPTQDKAVLGGNAISTTGIVYPSIVFILYLYLSLSQKVV